MRKLIFIADGKIANRSNSKYDKYIGFTNEVGDERFAAEGNYYTCEDFAQYIRGIKPQGIVFDFKVQQS